MAPTNQMYSIWAEEDYDSSNLSLDCLLPTGVIIQLNVQKDDSISSIKQKLWYEARTYPLYNMLKNMDSYVFLCINEMAVKVELTDESRRLCDVRPFQPMLKLVESMSRVGMNKDERVMNAQISVLMGKGLIELESITDPEVIDFRKHMRFMCEKISQDKDNQDWLQQALCYHPPDLAVDPELPEHIRRRLENGFLIVTVRLEQQKVAFSFQVSPSLTPRDLIQMAFDKRSKTSGEPIQSVDNFVLKLVGLQEYLLGNNPLSQYLHIRQKIANGSQPDLIIVSQDSVIVYKPPPPPRGLPKTPNILPHVDTPKKEEEKMSQIGHSLFDIIVNYGLSLENVANVDLDNFVNVTVRACLYHGGDNLCNVLNYSPKPLKESGCIFNETLFFEIELRNIPRMARLCLLLYSLPDGKKKKVPTATLR